MSYLDKLINQFIKLNHRMKKWQRVVSVLSAVVVFVTTYALILPAITLDKETASSQPGIEVAASEANVEERGTAAVVEPEPEEETAVEGPTEPEPVMEDEPENSDGDDESADAGSDTQSGESFSDEEPEYIEDTESEENKDEEPEEVEDEKPEDSGETRTEEATDDVTETLSDDITDTGILSPEDLNAALAAGEIPLITEKTQLVYEYIDEEYEKNREENKTKEAGENSEEDDMDDGYFVYAEFDASAKLPEGVELQVKEITKESDPELYDMYCNKTLSEVQDKYDENTGITFAKFYDISFVYQGIAIEPSSDVKIRIEYKREIEVRKDEKVDAIHFDKEADEKPEVIESEINPDDTAKDGKEEREVDGNSENGEVVAEPMKAVEFTSDRFSVYGVVGTGSITTTFLSADGNTYEVTLNCDTDANIAAGSELVVSEVEATADKYEEYIASAAAAMDVSADKIAYAKLLDISIVKDGEEIIPETPVNVEIKLLDKESFDENESLNVIHYESGNEKPVLVDGSEQDGVVSFEAEGFSVYGVFYTVDFYWAVNGKMYEFTFPGGSFVSFTELMEMLGVADNDAQSLEADNSEEAQEEENSIELVSDDLQVSAETKKFVADVEKVEFSSPDLVWVGKVDSSVKVGGLKEANSLEVEYSAELTEEQIAHINERTIDAGDWALISLKPFTSEETLTVTMKDGETFNILVTDRQYGASDRANVNVPNLQGFVTVDMFNYGPANRLDSMYNSSDSEHGNSIRNEGINTYSNLKFVAYGSTTSQGGRGFNAFTGGSSIYQDIVKRKLVDDYPVLNDTSNKSLSYLFDRTPLGPDDSYKSVTSDVQGLFYKANYNGSSNDNGLYYAYDSDRYYAYLNESNVELYNTYKFNTQNYYGGVGVDPNVNNDGFSNKGIGFFPYTRPNDSNVCPHPSDVNWHNNWHNELRGKYDHQFGLTMSAQFEMPLQDANGRQTVGGQDMIFSFSGDDDMWVFIDDVLVLDIGGLHHPSSGSINFTQGTVTIDNSVYSSTGINKGNRTVSIKDIFSNAGENWVSDGHSAHTIKVFYLERGGIYSNCKIVFNLPLILGKGTVSVVKKDADPENTENDGKLEGAIFGLWENPQCTGDPFMTRVSGSNGLCTFEDLSVGDDLDQTIYYMKEIKAPYDYKLDDTIYTLKLIPDSSDVSGYKRDSDGNYVFQLLGQDGTSLHVLEQEPHWPYIENEEAAPIGLKVQKKWQDADNTTVFVDPPAGVTAKFRVKRWRIYDVVELGTDNIHRIIRSVRELDRVFNADNANVIQLPVAGSATPWEYVYNNLTLAEQGRVTIGNKSYDVQYYYEYYIEESETPDGYETIYLDDNNQELFGEHEPSELATDEDGQTQTVINRELLDIPARKYWDDFLGDGYKWVATLQLDYRDIPVPSAGVNVNDIQWQEYQPRNPKYCKQISKAAPEAVFEDLPEYITGNDGSRYRREYSIVEVAYTVTRLSDNTVVFKYDKDSGVTIPQGDTYTPWFDHDAGEDDDYDDDIYPGADDYNIVVHNLRENRNIQKDLHLSIEKEWPNPELSTSSESKAVFRLRRYILTEYRNYEGTNYELAPRVVINLSDGAEIIETRTVPQGVPMSIHGYLKPGASGAIVFNPGVSYSADNQTSEQAVFDIPFTANENMTLTLASGEELVVGEASGFRFKESESTTQPEELDTSFLIEFELSNGQWSKSFPEDNPGDQQHHTNDVLPAVEVSVLDANGNTANVYVYKYFFEEVECTPSSFNATFTDSDGNELLGDKEHLIYFDSSVKATNRPTGLDLLKVDMDHPERTLSGAKFQMRKLDVDENTGVPYKVSPNGQYVGSQIIEPNAEATDEDGKLIFKPDNGLEAGYYEVIETDTPDGYILLEDPTFYIKVEELGVIKLLKKDNSGSVLWDQAAEEGETVVNASISSSSTVQNGKTITITVSNQPGPELPHTGGPGTTMIYLLGLMLTAFAGAGFVMSRKKKAA